MIDPSHLRTLLSAATARPWAHRMGEIVQLSDGGKGYPIDYYPDCADVVAKDRDGDLTMSDADADLICAAVNALPELLEISEAAQSASAASFRHRCGETDASYRPLPCGMCDLDATLTRSRGREQG